MAGIDSIIDRILKDARESADARVVRAEEDAGKLIEKKKAQAKEEEARMLKDVPTLFIGMKEAEAVIASHAKQQRATQNTKSQRRILTERVAMIDEIIAEAKKRIRSLPSAERLAMVKSFVLANSEGADGELILSEADKKDLPGSFLEELSKETNSTIKLSDRTGDFEAGCILICGDYEYNGTLDAIVADKENEIRDTINQVLFAKK